MTVKKNITDKRKTITFNYHIQDLFDDVVLDTLTMAVKMTKDPNMDTVSEYGLTEDEKDQFENFLIEGHSKVFSRLLKMTSGVLQAIELDFMDRPLVPMKKKIALALTGTNGSGTITDTGTGAMTIDFDTTLEQTATAFSTAYKFNYTMNSRLTLDFDGASLTFEANDPGVDFEVPVFENMDGSLNATPVTITENVGEGTKESHTSCTIKDKEGYNENYLDIIDKEIYLGIKHYVLKEWYVKCLLADQAKYYESKYTENIVNIQKYGLMLRKPRSRWTPSA